MPATQERIAVWLCRHCGYKWTPRVEQPIHCPSCQKRRP